MKDPTRARQQAAKSVELAYKLAEAASAKSLESYLSNIVIDCRPTPDLFKNRADPWQWFLARKVIPALENISQIKPGYKGPLNFWFTLPRGSDKTSFIGRLVNGVLAFSKITVSVTACAADRDQAGLLLDAMQTEGRLNRWLGRRLEFTKGGAFGKNNSSRLQIIASDAPSASGLRDDLYVLDEVTEWKKRDLFGMIYSARDKRPEGVVIVITNSGVMGTWQHEIVTEAKNDPNWFVFEADGPIASWVSKEALENQKKYLTEAEYLRKVMNVWIDPSIEYGFVPKSAIMHCMAKSAERGITRAMVGDPTKRYTAAIDYGLVRDRTCLVILHAEPDGTMVVDRMDVWQGSKDNPVKVSSIEEWIDEVRSNYRLSAVIIDPYQLEGLYQRYVGRIPIKKFEFRGGKGNHELGEALRSTIMNGNLLWYPKCGAVMFKGKEHYFSDELNEVITKQMGYGWRIDTLPGHFDDRVIAVGTAVHSILENKLKKPFFYNEQWL